MGVREHTVYNLVHEELQQRRRQLPSGRVRLAGLFRWIGPVGKIIREQQFAHVVGDFQQIIPRGFCQILAIGKAVVVEPENESAS